MSAFIPLILMFAIFYFLLIRPQQKKAKQQKAMHLPSGRVTGSSLPEGFTG